MNSLWFCLIAAGFFTLMFAWGFRVLPREEWQFLAVMPRRRLADGAWEGLNFTFYGIFNAVAHVLALILFIILTASVGVPILMSLATILVLMAFCLPASNLLARWIEKKPYNFTVSGAFFTGVIFAPVAIWLSHYLTAPASVLPLTPVYAAMAIAYAVGEGTGRLGCISFGCCYGKPLSVDSGWRSKIIRSLAFVFTGKTKKICYASGWEGVQVWPVQAFTAVIFIVTSLIATYAFLSEFYRFALLWTIAVTQAWRIFSETLRADYRGGGDVSVYQVFSMVSIAFVVLAWTILPQHHVHADLTSGLKSLANIPFLLFLEAWAVFIFWFTGRSRVTGSSLHIHVKEENI